jgi:hypothetical protein
MFNWNLPATPLQSPDPEAVAPVVDSGKLGVVGGSSGGLLQSTAEVGIALLDVTGSGGLVCSAVEQLGRVETKCVWLRTVLCCRTCKLK